MALLNASASPASDAQQLTLDWVRDHSSLPWVQAEWRCEGGCDEVFERFLQHPTWACSGQPNVARAGSWLGHIFPGVMFVVWGVHWLLGFAGHYGRTCVGTHTRTCSGPTRTATFISQCCYPVLWFPERLPLEALGKVLLPVLAMLLELWLAQSAGYRSLLCPGSAPRAGRFNGDTVSNWQHAAMYPGFAASGLADLVSLKVELPPGTTHVFLSLAFLQETLLMALHQKHAPMDRLVHQLLASTCMACVAFPALEAAWPHSPLLTAGRVSAILLHGAWFLAAARIMFEPGRQAWDVKLDLDLTPVLYAPVVFVSLAWVVFMAVAAVMLLGCVYWHFRQATTCQAAVAVDALS